MSVPWTPPRPPRKWIKDSMVLRVARALFPGFDDPPACQCEGCRYSWTLHYEVSLSRARTAIEAMREPTAEMAWAGHDVTFEDLTGKLALRISADQAKAIFRAMIDAALR